MNEIGTRKVYWHEIRERVKKANVEFYTLVDQLKPDHNFPMYLLHFPYGELIGDKTSQFIPLEGKGLLRLSDPSLPAELIDHLGYGTNSSPMGMILDKQFEWYVDLPKKNIALPIMVQNPGDFFSYTRSIDIKSKFNYSPMGVLSAMSGARTAFMLPSIGCQNKLSRLGRELGVKIKQPNHLYDHFQLFKTILKSTTLENTWNSSLIYFSTNWIHNIKTNPDWYHVQKYFYSIFAQKSMYLKNLPHYQTAYSLLLESNNLKPNPYLFDTFKHIVHIMTGEMPGLAPQTTNELLPLNVLQNVFTDFYGLKTTVPTIMVPKYFNIETEYTEPIYYSLQFPTTSTFSPNSKKTSTMVAMRELKDMCIDLFSELMKDNCFCSNTIIQHIAKNICVDFFHNTDDMDGLISNVSELIGADSRFNFTHDLRLGLTPSGDSKFFRGCMRIALQK